VKGDSIINRKDIKEGNEYWCHVSDENYIEKYKVYGIYNNDNTFDCSSVEGYGNRFLDINMIYETEADAIIALDKQRKLEVEELTLILDSKEKVLKSLFRVYSFHENSHSHESDLMHELIKKYFDIDINTIKSTFYRENQSLHTL